MLRFALPFLLCVASSASPVQDQDTAVVDKFIASQATHDGGEEYGEARKIVTGDLNRDGVPDLAVLYTIEGQNGTNNYIQYLAAFIRRNGALVHAAHTAVGGKWNRDVDLQSIKNNVIHCKTLSHRADDPASTPSRKGIARYVLRRRSLKEL